MIVDRETAADTPLCLIVTSVPVSNNNSKKDSSIMQKKNVTSTVQTAQTAQYLPAMLEGAYATSLENRIAQMNNHLAREGRMSNDPLVQIMIGMRHDLKAEGLTFERQVPQFAPVVAPQVHAAPVETAAPKAPRASTQGAPKAAATTAPKAAFMVREIKSDQLATIQVPGSETDVAPYGTDKQGRVLAPYGVKTDGSPARRRGRVAAASDEPQATMPEPVKAEVVAEAATANDISFDDASTAEAPTVAASDIEDEDFDALLSELG